MLDSLCDRRERTDLNASYEHILATYPDAGNVAYGLAVMLALRGKAGVPDSTRVQVPRFQLMRSSGGGAIAGGIWSDC